MARRKGIKNPKNSESSGSQPAASSAKKEDKNKQKASGIQTGKVSEKNDNLKRKDAVEFAGGTTSATHSGINKVVKGSEKATCDREASEMLPGDSQVLGELVSKEKLLKFMAEFSSYSSEVETDEVSQSHDLLQASEQKDIEERNQKLNLKAPEAQQVSFSENERTVLQRKSAVSECESLLQDCKRKDIDERIRLLEINASILQQGVSSKDESKLNEPETKEYEKIVNLRGDANLIFEFDELGNKKLLAEGIPHRIENVKHKITFNIGNGNAELSFIDNKVSISTRRGQVGCLMERNMVIFSLTDNIIHSDTLAESPSKSGLKVFKDASVDTNLGTTNKTHAIAVGSPILSEVLDAETDPENVHLLISKTDMLLASSPAQISAKNVLEKFLTNVITTCKDLENSFIKSLK